LSGTNREPNGPTRPTPLRLPRAGR
jgi:hypothetical protein